jgi:hypothetical protein
LFDPALNPLKELKKDALEHIMGRIPEGWITELSRKFAVELMCYNLEQLRRITP